MTNVPVVIPARNAAKTLTTTLRLSHDQVSSDWEAIVIDDGSTEYFLNVSIISQSGYQLVAT